MPIETAATLLERQRELTELDGALREAAQGRGKLIVVEAPAGAGKTSLLKAAMETAAEAGFACLRARASDLESDFAYGCVRQLLEPAVARAAEPDRERLFAGAAALSAGLFAPTGGAADSSFHESPFAMLHGLYWLLNNLADDAPVALCVDDLHWADAESLRFLNYLAPRLDGLAVAIVAGARPAESDAEELAQLVAAPEAIVLRPEPLSPDATAALCAQRLGPGISPEFAVACREATGGNPFLLEQLMREAAEQQFATDADGAVRVRGIGPAAVARAVVLRLAGRPPSATALVRAAAVLGDGASVGEAAELAELPRDDVAREADLLAALGILTPADCLEFAHPIVREAIYADIGARERAAAHARAARILTASGASPERIAAQLVHAEPAGNPERVDLLRRVAADALRRGAPHAARAWLDRALNEPPPPEATGDVLLELSFAKLRVGRPDAAIEPLTAAVDALSEPEAFTTAVRLLGGALTWSGQADRAVAAIGSAIDRLDESNRELALLLEADRAGYAQQGSLENRALAAARLESFADLPASTPGERLVLALVAFERARASELEPEAVAWTRTALAGGRLLREQDLDVSGALYLLADGLLGTDALDLVDELLASMLADAEASVSIPAQAFVIVHRGWAAMRRGDVSHAESDARTALELLNTHKIPLGTRFAVALLVNALIESDDVDGAERELSSSGFGDDIPPGMASNSLLEARGLLRIAQGRAREGVDDLIEFGRHDEAWGAANPLASRWRSRASLALAQTGELDARTKHGGG